MVPGMVVVRIYAVVQVVLLAFLVAIVVMPDVVVVVVLACLCPVQHNGMEVAFQCKVVVATAVVRLMPANRRVAIQSICL